MNNEEKILEMLTKLTEELSGLKGRISDLGGEVSDLKREVFGINLRLDKMEVHQKQLYDNQVEMNREWSIDYNETRKVWKNIQSELSELRGAIVKIEHVHGEKLAMLFDALDERGGRPSYITRLESVERRSIKQEHEIFELKNIGQPYAVNQ
jgi:predicted  nucleic acid-binding Zn-ribbon protein